VVLRISYHHDLTSIELIWADIKQWVLQITHLEQMTSTISAKRDAKEMGEYEFDRSHPVVLYQYSNILVSLQTQQFLS
jgi:hypothetical protein